MDKELLAYGIDITHELDMRFGLPPKITMSQVSHSNTGGLVLIRALHVGPKSVCPEVSA